MDDIQLKFATEKFSDICDVQCIELKSVTPSKEISARLTEISMLKPDLMFMHIGSRDVLAGNTDFTKTIRNYETFIRRCSKACRNSIQISISLLVSSQLNDPNSVKRCNEFNSLVSKMVEKLKQEPKLTKCLYIEEENFTEHGIGSKVELVSIRDSRNSIDETNPSLKPIPILNNRPSVNINASRKYDVQDTQKKPSLTNNDVVSEKASSIKQKGTRSRKTSGASIVSDKSNSKGLSVQNKACVVQKAPEIIPMKAPLLPGPPAETLKQTQSNETATNLISKENYPL